MQLETYRKSQDSNKSWIIKLITYHFHILFADLLACLKNSFLSYRIIDSFPQIVKGKNMTLISILLTLSGHMTKKTGINLCFLNIHGKLSVIQFYT